jgi:diaminohydroxyphosphoribosylaminopyrimidine deaminase/5-amino-6-(5-phosphoribosylamino)uracil reductase
VNVIDLDRPAAVPPARNRKSHLLVASALVIGAVMGAAGTYGWSARRQAADQDRRVSVFVFAEASQFLDGAPAGSVVLDGRVATVTGDARWVSGPEARTLVHRWRAELDGVLVGRGTALADDPALTVRLVEGRQPVRIVLDRPGNLPAHLQLFTDAQAVHTVAVTGESARPAYAEALLAAGGRVLRIAEDDAHLDLGRLMEGLGREGGRDGLPLQSVLVEAGPGLATALFARDLVDRFYLFTAPRLVGRGVPLLDGLTITRLRDALDFAEGHWEQIGGDILFRGYRRPVPDLV